ncbi:MAG TPA: type II toxin-antitoxin system death-on-curing family toxin [Ignavibacteria bacterium]|nr:type II toxin-antitoxin system death-on-curing family toxin [Ignavibacteria bacterium]
MKKYLSVKDVIYIQKILIDEFGGIHGIRDLKAIESAVSRPQSGYYKSLIEEAAALMESLAINHCFIDGNKRVSFFSTDVFLRMNGYYISCDPEEANQFYVNNLSSGSFRFEKILRWLKQRIKKIE